MRFTSVISSSLLLAGTTLANPQADDSPAVSTVVAAALATNLPITPGSPVTNLNSTTSASNTTSSTGALTSATSNSGNSLAQNTTADASTDAEVTVWAVKVGNEKGQFVFEPNVINAAVGDMVQFQFYARNHSVVSSTYENPCVPQRNIEANVRNAFFSGFMPTNATGELLYTIEVTDTKAQWFYCSQGKHCQAGMVGVINPPKTGDQTIAKYVSKAALAPDNLTPTFDGKANIVTSGTPAVAAGGAAGSAAAASSVASSSSSSVSSSANMGNGRSQQADPQAAGASLGLLGSSTTGVNSTTTMSGGPLAFTGAAGKSVVGSMSAVALIAGFAAFMV